MEPLPGLLGYPACVVTWPAGLLTDGAQPNDDFDNVQKIHISRTENNLRVVTIRQPPGSDPESTQTSRECNEGKDINLD